MSNRTQAVTVTFTLFPKSKAVGSGKLVVWCGCSGASVEQRCSFVFAHRQSHVHNKRQELVERTHRLYDV